VNGDLTCRRFGRLIELSRQVDQAAATCFDQTTGGTSVKVTPMDLSAPSMRLCFASPARRFRKVRLTGRRHWFGEIHQLGDDLTRRLARSLIRCARLSAGVRQLRGEQLRAPEIPQAGCSFMCRTRGHFADGDELRARDFRSGRFVGDGWPRPTLCEGLASRIRGSQANPAATKGGQFLNLRAEALRSPVGCPTRLRRCKPRRLQASSNESRDRDGVKSRRAATELATSSAPARRPVLVLIADFGF
jgi:hypothetical protein